MPIKPLSDAHSPSVLVLSSLVGDDPGVLAEHLADHLDYLKPFVASGQMSMGGPLQELNGRFNGDGLYLLNVDSIEEARAIAENDPLHLRGVRRFRMLVWHQKSTFIAH